MTALQCAFTVLFPCSAGHTSAESVLSSCKDCCELVDFDESSSLMLDVVAADVMRTRHMQDV